MGTYYQVYAEACYGGWWHSIDYSMQICGTRLLPVIEGGGEIGKALEFEAEDIPLDPHNMSEELKAKHSWLLKEDAPFPMPQVTYIPGGIFMTDKYDKPEFSAFVPKHLIREYEAGNIDEIDEFLFTAEFKDLPLNEKAAYRYFEWTPRFGSYDVFRRLKERLKSRLDDFNAHSYYLPQKEIWGAVLGLDECRLVVIRS